MRVMTGQKIPRFISKLKKRSSSSAREDDVQKIVRKIIDDVRKQGDRAVKRYTRKFDAVEAESLKIRQREIDAAARKVERGFVPALKASAGRIRLFHERQKEPSWQFTKNGVTLGQLIRPLQRVGVYVPGGKASYPSSVLMNIIPAQVAGVREIAVCVPTPGGVLNPHVACAIRHLGMKEVYGIGGAQAVAALAYGTETLNQVDKIVGPGNIFVAVAKRMVFGDVGIDMVAGPSEILIVADSSADPVLVAADMLSQAEHDEMASAVLVTDSKTLAEKVRKELTRQLKDLMRKEIASEALKKYGAILVMKNMGAAADIVNEIAPEHLEIMTKNPKELLPHIKNAGAVFLGRWTPEPLGDYAAGPNHTLPTRGTARFSSPLGVYDFLKRTSLVSATRSGFMNLAGHVETLAEVEGLEAHGNTVRVRKESRNT